MIPYSDDCICLILSRLYTDPNEALSYGFCRSITLSLGGRGAGGESFIGFVGNNKEPEIISIKEKPRQVGGVFLEILFAYLLVVLFQNQL